MEYTLCARGRITVAVIVNIVKKMENIRRNEIGKSMAVSHKNWHQFTSTMEETTRPG
jgi:hypothetical protein